MQITWLLPLLIFAAAVLYSSVGHAGASGYLVSMALVGIAPDVMKPCALILNILVATIATIRFASAGLVPWKSLLPFVVGSIPLAFLGGAISLPGKSYKIVLGVILFFTASRLLYVTLQKEENQEIKEVPPIAAVTCGAVIGILSGLTGTGGGIFLSPILLFMRWADTKTSSGICSAFILVNSIAGLAGHFPMMTNLPPMLPIWALMAVIGGFIGSYFGAKRFDSIVLKRVLSVVLVIASLKLIFA